MLPRLKRSYLSLVFNRTIIYFVRVSSDHPFSIFRCDHGVSIIQIIPVNFIEW